VFTFADKWMSPRRRAQAAIIRAVREALAPFSPCALPQVRMETGTPSPEGILVDEQRTQDERPDSGMKRYVEGEDRSQATLPVP